MNIRQRELRHPASRIILIFLAILCIAPANLQAQDIDQAGDSIRYEAARLLSEYISYPSVSGNEKPAGEYFAELCRKKELYVRVFTDSVNCYNFAASLYPLELNKPNVILLNHIDVVTAGESSQWDHPAFSGDVVQDTVWGRGALDMKCAAIMQLLAVSSLTDRAHETDLPMNVTLLCVSGEETFGTTGSKMICNSFLSELNPAVLLGEGGIGIKGVLTRYPERPVFLISTNEKRVLWIKLYLNYETSGHGAIPPPEYANKMMINALSNLTDIKPKVRFNQDTRNMFTRFGELEKGLKGFIIKNPCLFRPVVVSGLRKNPLMLSTVTNTVTITQFVSQETYINQIPQEITVLLDCRLLPETSTASFLGYLRKKLRNSQIDISIIEETQNAPSSPTDRYYDLFSKAIIDTYPDAAVIPILFPATTDNNFFRNKGIPVYGLIPALLNEQLLETIHNYNERIPVDALVSGTAVYSRFLEKIMNQSN